MLNINNQYVCLILNFILLQLHIINNIYVLLSSQEVYQMYNEYI